MLLSFIGIVLMLDSVWTLIIFGMYAFLVIIRTKLEDDTLQAELPGYREYTSRTRYRLLPGVW
jgi:protein-S-isoprenylcysteine O-methyltransferase Ste14